MKLEIPEADWLAAFFNISNTVAVTTAVSRRVQDRNPGDAAACE